MLHTLAAASGTTALVDWGGIRGELTGALAVATAFAAVWLVVKVVKGDVLGFAKILGSAFIGVVTLGLLLVMAKPDTASALVSRFLQ